MAAPPSNLSLFSFKHVVAPQGNLSSFMLRGMIVPQGKKSLNCFSRQLKLLSPRT